MAGTYELVMDKLTHLGNRVDEVYQAQVEAAREWERVRGRKPVRFRASAIGTPSFAFGGDGTGQVVGTGPTSSTPIVIGPEQGFVWSVRDLVVEGLTANAATPDILNIRINNATGPLFWQVNGNNFGVTFGRGEKVLYPGESLFFQAGSTFATTSAVKVFGLTESLPAERVGEFY